MSRTFRRIVASAVVTAVLGLGGIAMVGLTQDMDDSVQRSRAARTEPLVAAQP